MLTNVGSCLLFVGWERKTWPINNAPTYMSRYNSTKKKLSRIYNCSQQKIVIAINLSNLDEGFPNTDLLVSSSSSVRVFKIYFLNQNSWVLPQNFHIRIPSDKTQESVFLVKPSGEFEV